MWCSWDFPFETQDSIIECLEIIRFNWKWTMSKWTEIGSFNTEIKGFFFCRANNDIPSSMTMNVYIFAAISFYNLNKHQIYTCCVTHFQLSKQYIVCSIYSVQYLLERLELIFERLLGNFQITLSYNWCLEVKILVIKGEAPSATAIQMFGLIAVLYFSITMR